MEEDRIGVRASAALSAACAVSSFLSFFFWPHGMRGPTAPAGHQKHTSRPGGTESQPLDRQGSPYVIFLFNHHRWWDGCYHYLHPVQEETETQRHPCLGQAHTARRSRAALVKMGTGASMEMGCTVIPKSETPGFHCELCWVAVCYLWLL